jgi:hypothetical protein
MATVYTDLVEVGVNVTQVQGVNQSATRRLLVAGLSGSAVDTQLSEVLGALTISYGTAFPGDPNLIAQRFDIKTAGPANNRKVYVDIEYVRYGDDDGTFVFHGGASVTEEQTNSDAHGNALTVQYTDPTTSVTDTQIQFAKVLIPEITLHTTGIKATADPVAVQKAWVGYVNSDSWRGYQPYHWMCTQCLWEPFDLNASPPKYKFTFDFQARRKSWEEFIYYHDTNGQLPSDAIPGIGTRYVLVQGTKAFGTEFPD